MSFEDKDLKNVIGFLTKLRGPEAIKSAEEKLPGMANYLICLIEEYVRTKEYNNLLIKSLSEIPGQMTHNTAVKENSEAFAELFMGISMNIMDLHARAQQKSLLL